MKVRLMTSMAGPGVSHSVGDVIDVPAEQGERLIAKGLAAPVAGSRKKSKKKASKKRAGKRAETAMRDTESEAEER